jgi:multiple sugar transport system substrate-binding protein
MGTELRTRRTLLREAGVLGALVGAPSVLAACGGGSESTTDQTPTTASTDTRVAGTITVATMAGGRWEPPLRATAEAYKKVNPKATVNIAASPFNEHYQKLANQLATDSDSTDVWVLDVSLVGQSQSKLQPLDDLFESDKEWKDSYLSGVPALYRDSWSWEGRRMAVVHDANAMMSWWRSDVLKDGELPEPATLETMLANAKVLSGKKAGSGFMTTAAAGPYLAVLYTGMMCAFGGKWWENDAPDQFGRISADNKPGEILLDSPENVAAMTMLRDLIQIGNRGSLNAQEFENNAAFEAGLVHQQVIYSGLMQLQSKKQNPKYWDKLVSGGFPLGGNNTNKMSTGVKAGYGLAIPKASKNVDLAFDFAKFYSSRENAERVITSGGQPANATILREQSTKPGYQVFGTIADMIVAGHHQAQFPESGDFYDTMSNSIAQVITGKQTPEAGCNDMKSSVETLFKRAGYV